MKFILIFFCFFSFIYSADFWKIDVGTPVDGYISSNINKYDIMDSMVFGYDVINAVSCFNTVKTKKRNLSYFQVEYYKLAENFSFSGDWSESNFMIGYTSNQLEEYVKSFYQSKIKTYEQEYGLGGGKFSIKNQDYYIGLPFYYQNDTSFLITAKFIYRKFEQRYLYNTSLIDDSLQIFLLKGKNTQNDNLYYTSAYNKIFSKGFKANANLNYFSFGIEKTMRDEWNRWKVSLDIAKSSKTKGKFISLENSYSNTNRLATVTGGKGTFSYVNKSSFAKGSLDIVGTRSMIGLKYILNQYSEFYINLLDNQYYQTYRPSFNLDITKFKYSENTISKSDLMTDSQKEFISDILLYKQKTITKYREYTFGISFFI